MFLLNDNRIKKLNDILLISKLSSLLFTVIILIQYFYMKGLPEFTIYSNISYIFICGIGLLLILYYIWNVIAKSKAKATKLIKMCEPIIFMSIFIMCLHITGGYDSKYKFMFLFIIISTTIESGIHVGMFFSIASSLLILGTDMFCAPTESLNLYFETDLLLSTVFIFLSWIMGYYAQTEKAHIAMLQDMVNKDGLTKLYNHRYFHNCLEGMIKNDTANDPISLLFMDIDHFKKYNDMYGHQMGDEVLERFAQILHTSPLNESIAARYGGEEFAIILPHTTEEEAKDYAEHLRKLIENEKFEGQEYLPDGNLTVSIGVSEYPLRAKNEIELIKLADEALYRAKFLRRNSVEGYNSILDDIANSVKDENTVASIKTLIAVINSRDKYTFSHTERVVQYCKLFIESYITDANDKKNLAIAAYMHDIGKINISKEVLIKSAKLTDAEWAELKTHPNSSAEIISKVDGLKDIVPIVLHHHEKYDGTGYPTGLKGKEIPYLSRVLTVIDSFDAMTSDRPYHIKKTYKEGVKELERCSGTQFDPEIAQQFIEIVKKEMIYK